MKRIKKFLLHTVAFCLIALLTVSCELFGLEYQTDYENKTSSVEKELGISCFDFIESRRGLDFSLLYEAIMLSDMKSFYETDGLTFFLLTDDDFASWLVSYRYTSVKSTPKAVLQNFMKSYTVKGLYSSADLTTSLIDVITLDEIKIIRMGLYYMPSTSTPNLHQFTVGYVKADGTVNFRGAKTTNLKATNGIMHILREKF